MISPHLLSIDASHSQRTYLACMEGVPSANQMIESAKKLAVNMWGERATLVIDPTVKGKMLPTWCHMIWATGPIIQPADETVSDDSHGSELVVIWWSEFEPDTKRVLDAVDWEKNAKGFYY